MTKDEALAYVQSKIGDDEPVFVLRAQDRTSSGTVRDWTHRAKNAGCKSEAKIDEALDCAVAMDRWRTLHGGGKVPD